jgi:aminoglycoside N3'-acetyltransferase
LAKLPGARRSGHPDASMLAIGAAAEHLAAEHPLESAYGPGSPLERFLELEGKVLLLGAQPDALTVLHYAEAIAPIPHKRRVSYEMPVLDAQGRPEWRRVEDFDSNGVLDIYAAEGGPDAVERIGREYLRRDRHREGRVGAAAAQLIDARDLVRFGVAWLVARHGGERG